MTMIAGAIRPVIAWISLEDPPALVYHLYTRNGDCWRYSNGSIGAVQAAVNQATASSIGSARRQRALPLVVARVALKNAI